MTHFHNSYCLSVITINQIKFLFTEIQSFFIVEYFLKSSQFDQFSFFPAITCYYVMCIS